MLSNTNRIALLIGFIIFALNNVISAENKNEIDNGVGGLFYINIL